MPFDDFKTRPGFNTVKDYNKSKVIEFNNSRKDRIKSLKI